LFSAESERKSIKGELGHIYTANIVNLFPSFSEQDHNTGLPNNALGGRGCIVTWLDGSLRNGEYFWTEVKGGYGVWSSGFNTRCYLISLIHLQVSQPWVILMQNSSGGIKIASAI
jgi:hypothetical protein